MAFRILHRQTTYWDLTGPSGVERVHFVKKQEHFFLTPECDSVEIVNMHPVLVDYQHAWVSIYVSTAPESAEAVLQDVSARVASMVGPWRTPGITSTT